MSDEKDDRIAELEKQLADQIIRVAELEDDRNNWRADAAARSRLGAAGSRIRELEKQISEQTAALKELLLWISPPNPSEAEKEAESE